MILPCGSAYLDGNDEEGLYHLHVVASDQDREGMVVVVSISTLYKFADKTVLLKAGEHSWIKHDSYVAYAFAKLQKLAELVARLQSLPNMAKDACTDNLLKKIQVGIMESEQTENGVKHFFKEVHPDW